MYCGVHIIGCWVAEKLWSRWNECGVMYEVEGEVNWIEILSSLDMIGCFDFGWKGFCSDVLVGFVWKIVMVACGVGTGLSKSGVHVHDGGCGRKG